MRFYYPSIIVFISSLLLLSSCKVYDESMLLMTRDPIDPKLPSLKMTYGNNNSVSYGDPCACELNMLSDEIEFNLTEFYGEQYGYISFQIQHIDYGYGGGYILPSLCSWTILNILGMPLMAFMQEIELKVTIMDSNRQLLKKYTARGKARVPVAYYYGYREKYAGMLVNSFALNTAMEEIRNQIKSDAVELREKLLYAGPLKHD